MVFSSLTFLFIFMPLLLILYFAIPNQRAKNIVLIVFSLLFYAWGEPLYVFLMVGSVAVNWGLGLLTERYSKRLILAIAVVFDLGCLAVFKYAGFLVENFNAVFGTVFRAPAIALPIGISFYTFQILTYMIDVCRGRVAVQRSFGNFLLYVSLFPQLIAGPIVRYSDVEPQLRERKIEWDSVFYGFFRFSVGLAKKVLLADHCGSAASKLLDGPLHAQTTLGVWFGILLFMFEIYFDFSGYSDMAIGLGRVFGFRFQENFRLPYTAKSITDFWRRWHISLSSFFRDYVYIPLGGNRKHVYLNLAIVWCLTGLWHGASWNFVLWGAYFFVLLTIERIFKRQIPKIPLVLRHIATLLLILVGWNIFYFTDWMRLCQSFAVMFTGAGSAFCNHQTGISMLNALPLVIACIIGSTPLPQIIGNTISMLCTDENNNGWKQRIYVLSMFVFCAVLLILSVIS
ncbi:MAG: MBOAT family protein, partial [Oscillospiraceae bacterium]|nr:MBOAT family protein [Oscillospiraceae bacterium]